MHLHKISKTTCFVRPLLKEWLRELQVTLSSTIGLCSETLCAHDTDSSIHNSSCAPSLPHSFCRTEHFHQQKKAKKKKERKKETPKQFLSGRFCLSLALCDFFFTLKSSSSNLVGPSQVSLRLYDPVINASSHLEGRGEDEQQSSGKAGQ